MLMSIKSPPMMVEILAYAESVAKVMAATSTPICKSRCLSIHPFVDDVAIKCNDVERHSMDGEGVEEDMDSHDGFYLE